MLIERIHGDDAKSASRSVGLALAAHFVVDLIRIGLHALRSTDAFGYDRGDLFYFALPLLSVASLGLTIWLALGIRRYRNALGSVAGPVRWALGSAIVLVVVGVSFLLYSVAGWFDLTPAYDPDGWTHAFFGGLSFVRLVAWMFALVLLALEVARIGSAYARPPSPGLVWGTIGAQLLVAAMGLVQFFTSLLQFAGEGAWLVYSLVFSLATVPPAVLMIRHAAELSTVPENLSVRNETAPAAEGEGRFRPAGLGLNRYANGLVAQFFVNVIGVVVMVGLARARNIEAAQAMMVLVPLASLIAQSAVLNGVSRYAGGLPRLTYGRSAARTAVMFHGIGFMIGLVALACVARAVSSGRYRHLSDLQDVLPVMEAVSGVVGLIAVLSMLSSYAQVAKQLQGAKAMPSRGFLKPSFVVLAVLLPVARIGGSSLGIGLLFIGLALLGLGITCIVSYLKYTREMAHRLMLA